MTQLSTNIFFDLPRESLSHIETFLPLPAHWALRFTCHHLHATLENTEYWKHLITRLGIQPPEDSSNCKLAVASFFHCFNDQMTAAVVVTPKLMAYGRYQDHMTALREEVLRNRVLDFSLQEKSLNLDTFLYISRLYPISEEKRGKAVWHAAKNNLLNTAVALLQTGPISYEDRSEAMVEAAVRGFFDIALALLNSGQITEESHHRTVMLIVEDGQLDILQTLLQAAPIDPDLRNAAAMLASEKGYLDILKALLQNGPFSRPHLILTLITAAGSGRLDIVQELLKVGPLTEYERGRVVSRAAASGFFNIVHAVLEMGPIDHGNLCLVIPAYMAALCSSKIHKTLLFEYQHVVY